MHEDFLKFVPIYEVNGKNLANTIVEELKNMNIEVSNLRGYDGAAVMSGKMNGVFKKILIYAKPLTILIV